MITSRIEVKERDILIYNTGRATYFNRVDAGFVDA